ELERVLSAARARGWDARRAAAVVTSEDPAALVDGHRHGAIGALRRPAATRARQKGRVAATILQDDGLLPAIEALADRFLEVGGEHGIPRNTPHVDDADIRKDCGLASDDRCAVGQLQERVLAAARVVEG